VRGEVAVDLRTDEPDRRFTPHAELRTARGRLTVASSRWSGARLLVRFEEARDRTAAERLRGADLFLEVSEDERPDDPDEFYDRQLVGLRAVDEDGADMGVVGDVLHLPAHDVLVVERGGRQALVPFVTEFVPAVDLSAGSLTVCDRAGLLDDLRDDADETAAER
jgi:16S rRNA processing protein RimM